ncbi:MAG: zinc ribbon domain-containing protein [Chthoniobacterales bacterium]
MSKRSPLPAPEICPVCGEEVSRNALACRECGADHNSGWRIDADLHDALGESSEDFDYDDFVRSEFGSSVKPGGIRTLWWITALILLLALGALYFLTR